MGVFILEIARNLAECSILLEQEGDRVIVGERMGLALFDRDAQQRTREIA